MQGRVHFDLRRLIDGLRAHGHEKIALLCHDPRDIRFAAGYPDIPYLYTEDPLRYLAWLRDCRLNVGYRVHSLLPCALLGTPSVHLTYDERALGLIETAGLGDCAVDYIHDPDPVVTALAMCADTDRLRQAMAIARVTWAPLRHAMLHHLNQWLNMARRS
jgi:polysaccharide pyruvyl transferase WcaK-like protein